MPIHSTATPDMTSPTTSGRHLSKFEKTAENDPSDGIASNFSGAAFCLAQPIGGLLGFIILSSFSASAPYYIAQRNREHFHEASPT